MQPNEKIIRDFIAAWSRLDPAELIAYFTEDGVYHNMPGPPVAGRANVEKLVRGFLGAWTETRWEILNLLCEGDVVIAERVDRTKAGAKAVDLPCCGVFLMRGGRIAVWRDYFDMGTYLKAMA
jgi:limonene-1,2-epoxide hydrolase